MDPSLIDPRTLNWEDLFPKLVLIAERHHRRILWDTPGAPEPGDLVLSIVEKLLDGRRKLSVEGVHNLRKGLDQPEDAELHMLSMILKSEASNARKKESGVQRVSLEWAEFERGQASEGSSVPAVEREAADKAIRALVLARVSDDDVLVRLTRALWERPGARLRDLAEQLGVSVTTAHRARTRLRQRVAEIETDLREWAEG